MSAHELSVAVAKADNFGDWYQQVVTKGELLDYSKVSGCYILMPNSMFVWKRLESSLQLVFDSMKVKNWYFPLLIPKAVLEKEKKHVKGFSPEVAWVTETGKTVLADEDKLAIRPTSESIMYDYIGKKIQGYQDLPIKMNQWANVVRWEFSNATPFIRSREFLWQEGHSLFATKLEAQGESFKMLNVYQKVYKDMLAVPTVRGQKTLSETFPGADVTLTVESYIPGCGRGLQSATVHQLGQRFGEIYDITFEDKDMTKKHPYQNSWGFSTRSIGATVMTHSDDTGVVWPPKVAPTQIVVVPIFKKTTKDKVMAKCNEFMDEMSGYYRMELDSRDKRPGWKYNYWEQRGVPLRVEIGPKDVDSNNVVVVTRDDKVKTTLSLSSMDAFMEVVDDLMDQMQTRLYKKAEKQLTDNVVVISATDQLDTTFDAGKLALVAWNGSQVVEKDFRSKYEGVKPLCSPFKDEMEKYGWNPSLEKVRCLFTGEDAIQWTLFGKSF